MVAPLSEKSSVLALSDHAVQVLPRNVLSKSQASSPGPILTGDPTTVREKAFSVPLVLVEFEVDFLRVSGCPLCVCVG